MQKHVVPHDNAPVVLLEGGTNDGGAVGAIGRCCRAQAGGLKIALVGNGGLTEDCRRSIRDGDFHHVVRFNDMKNRRRGERKTLHVVRYRPDAWDGPFSGLSKFEHGCPLILVGDDHILTQPLDTEHGCYPSPGGRPYDVVARLSTRLRVFPTRRAAEPVNSARYGPSTGMLLVALFHARPEVTEIHTFGTLPLA